MERLSFAFCEVKAAADSASDMTFTGYGAVFGNRDSYDDVIAKGAFKSTLADARKTGTWPAMLEQHGGFFGPASDNTPIGIWTDLKEDDTGLKVEGKLADTSRGRDLYALMKMQPRPAIDGLSIGFRPVKFTMGTKPDQARRTLESVDLLEVSVVTFPANLRARITGVKANFDRIDQIETLSDAEELLREAGNFDRKAATAFVSRIKRMAQREADGEQLAAKLRRAAALLSS